jgi:hypothetical protein
MEIGVLWLIGGTGDTDKAHLLYESDSRVVVALHRAGRGPELTAL